jgi:hypothetical protein
MAPKIKASHYTPAQIARIIGTSYNRMRPIMARVPDCLVTIEGVKMIAAEHIPALMKASKTTKRQ